MPNKMQRSTSTIDSAPQSQTTGERYVYVCDGDGIEVDFTRGPNAPPEFIASITIMFGQGILRDHRLEGFSVWRSDQEGRDARYPCRKYTYIRDGRPRQGIYVLLQPSPQGDSDTKRRLNKSIFDAVDAALAHMPKTVPPTAA